MERDKQVVEWAIVRKGGGGIFGAYLQPLLTYLYSAL
jgi:hypothetical protein